MRRLATGLRAMCTTRSAAVPEYASMSPSQWQSFGIDRRVRSIARFYGVFDDVHAAFKPRMPLTIAFPSGAKVFWGNLLFRDDVTTKPTITFDTTDAKAYTLVAVDAGPATLGRRDLPENVESAEVVQRVRQFSGKAAADQLVAHIRERAAEDKSRVEKGEHCKLLWCVSNIHRDAPEGSEVRPFAAPQIDPLEIAERRLVFILYEQSSKSVQIDSLNGENDFFNSFHFAAQHGLQPVGLAFSRTRASEQEETEALQRLCAESETRLRQDKPVSGAKHMRWL